MNKLSRRGFLQVSGLAGLGLAAGCSSGPPSGTATWAMWSSSAAEKKVWEDFGKYVEHQLGVKSVATLTPSSGYPTKLDLQLVSGTTSLVTALNGTLIPTYAARGAHRPLDDLIEADPDFELDDFYDTSRKISSFNGRTYAIGFDVAPTVMYYNKDLLNKQGASHMLLTGGGIIPPQDIQTLGQRGIGKLFGPGSPTGEAIEYIKEWCAAHPRTA